MGIIRQTVDPGKKTTNQPEHFDISEKPKKILMQKNQPPIKILKVGEILPHLQSE